MGRGRAPCCDKSKVKKGPWTPAEDLRLITFVQKHGHPNWRSLPLQAGLLRCGKSCRLRWINYLRPDLKRGNFTKQEEETIINLHHSLGNKWSKIAAHFPGRTDNEIKNVWNTHLKKRLLIKKKDDEEDMVEAKQFSETSSPSSSVSFMSPLGNPDILQKGQEGDEPKQASISTSSSISSYASDYYSHPNGVDVHIPMPEQESGSLFNNNSDDQLVIEIPMESDTNFWDILDNLDTINLQSNEYSQTQEEFEPLQDTNIGGDQCDREIDEYGKWFRYLENELGLESNSYGSN